MEPSSRPDRDESFEGLLGELIDAHLDTIELIVCGGDTTTRAAHLGYLQGLVRYSTRLMAARHGQPRVR
jgi:hypothetical protein